MKKSANGSSWALIFCIIFGIISVYLFIMGILLWAPGKWLYWGLSFGTLLFVAMIYKETVKGSRKFYVIIVGLIVACLFCFVQTALTWAQERLDSNETQAIYYLITYRDAQTYYYEQLSYRIKKPSGSFDDTEHFESNFRNLYYYPINSLDESTAMRLISQALADAFVVDNYLGGTPTHDPAPKKAISNRGYLFQEDPSGQLPKEGYGKGYAFMAFPSILDETGRFVYWTSHNKKIYWQRPDLPSGTPAARIFEFYRDNSDSTPLSENPNTAWYVYNIPGLFWEQD